MESRRDSKENRIFWEVHIKYTLFTYLKICKKRFNFQLFSIYLIWDSILMPGGAFARERRIRFR
ncbi:MAG: hypothetical protein AUJ52_12055 [Elusimicrobia bacterium CG1_02_63_36]|nr:MAG: hypothetical protein AUJ52_12055 [Elusimicrobia bacterium CG1_02_63_36]